MLIALRVAASIREIVPSPWFNVHADPSPNVMNLGPLPTAISSVTRLAFGSTRATTLRSGELTHTALAPKVHATDPAGTSIVFTTWFVFPSIRDNSPFLSVTIQTLPAPVAIPPSESAGPALIVASIAPVSGLNRTSLCSLQLGDQMLPNP